MHRHVGTSLHLFARVVSFGVHTQAHGESYASVPPQSTDEVLDADPAFFSKFSVVIATQLQEKALLRLAAACWTAGVPLLIARAYGMIGYMRLVVPEHTVVEAHPDDSLADLRITRPFADLSSHADGIDLDALTSAEYSHVP